MALFSKHIIIIISITVVISLCVFFTYMPGDYDSFASTLSFMAQLLGFAGLIMVPIGILWSIHEIKKYCKKAAEPSNTTYYFAIVTFVALFITVLATSLTVFVSDNRSVGLIMIILSVYYSIKVIPKIRKLKNGANRNFNPIPLYLICIPSLILFIRFSFINKAVEYSRNIAIQKSEQLIKDIEIYYKNNGHYPPSMLSLRKDYKTSVTGIKQYHYEPSGKVYNLYFELDPGDLVYQRNSYVQ